MLQEKGMLQYRSMNVAIHLKIRKLDIDSGRDDNSSPMSSNRCM